MSRGKILWLSLRVAYDNVPHAGGKIHNYYLKGLHKLNHYDIKNISFCKFEERKKVDLLKYGIDHELIVYPYQGISFVFWTILNKLGWHNPFNRYAGLILNFEAYAIKSKLKKLHSQDYRPDIIILQWTQLVLLTSYIKKIFPYTKIVSIEEDVTFLGYKRKLRYTQNIISKLIWNYKFHKMLKLETYELNQADFVILNNPKDEKLIKEKGVVTKTWYWTPYFESMLNFKRKNHNKEILYYGAMRREENWRSALWFIKNVFLKIDDPEVRFVIAGNNPPKELLSYKSDKIVILGFVENIVPLFQESLCLVAPLVLGAGVKIKIIEGLSSGIPVLTNDIGIEGIPAKDGEQYFYCKEANDYLNIIGKLLENSIDTNQVEKKAKSFIDSNYNLIRDLAEFSSRIDGLLTKGGHFD